MSAINQCTRAITGEIRLVQYFRLCITCSAVGVCLNCASICHETHILGPLQRDSFYCQCDQITNCCRALNICVPSNGNSSKVAEVAAPPSKKKAAASTPVASDATNNPTPAPSASKKRKLKQDKPIVVWTKVTGGDKSLRDSFITKEGANREARRLFFEENPFKLAEAELSSSESFRETTEEDGTARYSCTVDGICWEVGCELSSKSDETVAPKEKKSKATSSKASTPAHVEPVPAPVAPAAPAPVAASLAPSKSATPVIAPSPAFDDDDDDVVIFAEIKPRYEELSEEKQDKSAEKSNKKKARPKKEVGAPKGPLASFMMFSNSNRERIAAENPGISMTEVSKIIGDVWKGMTPEEKLPYEERARADKERYAKEKEEFEQKKAAGELPPLAPTPAKPRKTPSKKKSESLPVPDSDSVVNQSPENIGSHVIEEDVSVNSPPMELDYSDDERRPQEVDSDNKSAVSGENNNDAPGAFQVYLSYEADGDNDSDSHPMKSILDKKFPDLRQANERVRSLAIQKGMNNSIEQDESSDHGLLTLSFSLPTGETWRVGVKKATSDDELDENHIIEL